MECQDGEEEQPRRDSKHNKSPRRPQTFNVVMAAARAATSTTGICSPKRRKWYIIDALIVAYHAYLAYALSTILTMTRIGCGVTVSVSSSFALFSPTFASCLWYSLLCKEEQRYCAILSQSGGKRRTIDERKLVQLVVYCVVLGAIATFLIIDSKGDRQRLISALGILVLVALAQSSPSLPGTFIGER